MVWFATQFINVVGMKGEHIETFALRMALKIAHPSGDLAKHR